MFIEMNVLTCFIFNFTPDGIPTETLADRLLCFETFFSTPYSTIPPKVPPLRTAILLEQLFKAQDNLLQHDF